MIYHRVTRVDAEGKVHRLRCDRGYTHDGPCSGGITEAPFPGAEPPARPVCHCVAGNAPGGILKEDPACPFHRGYTPPGDAAVAW